jgi:hypothetical protein
MAIIELLRKREFDERFFVGLRPPPRKTAVLRVWRDAPHPQNGDYRIHIEKT